MFIWHSTHLRVSIKYFAVAEWCSAGLEVEFRKTFFFYPPAPHNTPKSRPWGMTQADEWKSPSDMFYIFHLWEDTQTFGLKIFEIDFVIEI